MSKQKKGGHASDRDAAVDSGGLDRAPEVDPLLHEQGVLGNQALQAQLGSEGVTEAPVGLDVIRAIALPLVERAGLALELGPVDAGRHARFVEIVDGSLLSDDRKQVLLDKLSTDAAAGDVVRDAVARWFGDARQSDVSRVLDSVHAGLREGEPSSSGWSVASREVPVSDAALHGSVAARASALVGDVAEALAPPGAARDGAKGGVGAAVRGLCRDVVLAIAFEEEEEEEETPGWEHALEEG